MVTPQEQSPIADSPSWIEWGSDEVALPMLLVFVVVVGIAVWLRYERNPNWHTDRVNKAAKRAASRWAERRER